MKTRTEIHIDISKEDAYKLMEQGHKIRHRFYSDEEYLCLIDGTIIDENGYSLGNKYGEFWQTIQKWPDGWMTFNAR